VGLLWWWAVSARAARWRFVGAGVGVEVKQLGALWMLAVMALMRGGLLIVEAFKAAGGGM